MSDFKVGDKVRRIGGNCAGTVTGGIYTVKRFLIPCTVMLLEFPEDKLGWGASCFELVPQVNKFKVGATVRCINDGGYSITVGKLYTIKVIAGKFLRVTDDLGNVGGYMYTRFELAQEPVLTPEEVFKHLREGTKLEFRQKGTGSTWSGVTNGWCVQIREICNDEWRIKPVPEIIEANGRKYKLIEE